MTSLSLGLGLIQHAGWSNSNPPAFSPASIAGLELWLDASDAATMTQVDGKISQWSDKSKNDNHAVQPNASNQLTLGADALGSYLQSIGSGSATQSAKTWMRSTKDFTAKTLFFVVEHDGTQFSMIVGGTTGGTDSYIFLHGSEYAISLDGATGDTAKWWLDDDVKVINGGNAGAADAIGRDAHAHGVRYNAPAPKTLFNTLFAYRQNAVGGFGGKIREIISFDRYLSDEEVGEVNQYLMDKWGLA